MEEVNKEEKLLSRAFVLLICCSLGVAFMGQGVNSTASVYIEMLGGTASFAGVVAAIFSVSAGVFRIVAGKMMDYFSRKAMLLIGVIVLSITTLAGVVFTDLYSYAVLRALQGIGFAFGTTTAATAVAEVLPISRLGEGIGYQGLGQALAMALAPGIGIALVMSDTPNMLFYVFTGLGVVCLILVLLLDYEKKPLSLPETSAFRRNYEEKMRAEAEGFASDTSLKPDDKTQSPGGVSSVTVKDTAKDNAVSEAAQEESQGEEEEIDSSLQLKDMKCLLPICLLAPIFSFSVYFASLYGTSLNLSSPGWYYTCVAVSMIITRLMGKKFMDTIPPLKIMLVTNTCGIIAFILFLCASIIPLLFYVAGFFFGVFVGVNLPLTLSLAVKMVPSPKWPMMNAAHSLLNDFGIAVGSILWGAIKDAFGFSVVLIVIIIATVFAIFVAWYAYPKHGLCVIEPVEASRQ